jgi:hypothetical protein
MMIMAAPEARETACDAAGRVRRMARVLKPRAE